MSAPMSFHERKKEALFARRRNERWITQRSTLDVAMLVNAPRRLFPSSGALNTALASEDDLFKQIFTSRTHSIFFLLDCSLAAFVFCHVADPFQEMIGVEAALALMMHHMFLFPCAECLRPSHSLRKAPNSMPAGITVNQTDTDGWTPLHYAASSGHADCASALLAMGADFKQENQWGRTPFGLAVVNRRYDIAKILLHRVGRDAASRTAMVNGVRLSDGETLLHEAARSGYAEMVRLLLFHGANRCVKNKKDELPKEVAKNEIILEILQE